MLNPELRKAINNIVAFLIHYSIQKDIFQIRYVNFVGLADAASNLCVLATSPHLRDLKRRLLRSRTPIWVPPLVPLAKIGSPSPLTFNVLFSLCLHL